MYDVVRQRNTLRWWVTSLSYRNVHTSKTFHQSCYLKVGLDLVKGWDRPDTLVVVAPDAPVRRALQRNLTDENGFRLWVIGRRRAFPWRGLFDSIRMLGHRAFFILKEAVRLIQARRYLPHQYLPSGPTTLVMTPVHSGNLASGGDFHEASFGDLVNQLASRGFNIALSPMVLRDIAYKDALTQTSKCSIPLMVPHRSLHFMDIIRSVVSSLGKPRLPRPLPTLSGMDVSSILEEDLRTDWISNQAPDSLRVAATVRRWAQMDTSIDRIIYKYENQPWEKALCWEAKRSLPEATLVGYQHSRVPGMLLNFFLAPGEQQEAPLPDRVVTVGQYSAQLLSSDGYDGDRLRVGGALHMQDSMAPQGNAHKLPSQPRHATVLVACAVGLEEAAELVGLASELFQEDEEVDVIVKCHPITSIHGVCKYLGKPLPNHIQVSGEPITQLFASASVMVYTSSTVCVQALAHGLPMVHLRPQFDLDMDPLEAYPDLRLAGC